MFKRIISYMLHNLKSGLNFDQLEFRIKNLEVVGISGVVIQKLGSCKFRNLEV